MSGWIELRTVAPAERADAISQAAFSAGAAGLQEAPPPGAEPRFRQPWDTEDPPPFSVCTFRVWVAPDDADRASAAIGAAAGVPVERIAVEEEDWARSWRRLHNAVEISPRLRVAPPWQARDGDLVITPGNAFGTGDHPTTLACLRAIDQLADGCETCLDVGCGSGVLALAAAKLGLDAQGVDIDPASVRAAQEAAETNGLTAQFSDAPLSSLGGRFDLVVANLYAEVLQALAPELVRLTGRRLVLAGILADRADGVVAALSPPLVVRERLREGDWVCLHLERETG